MLHNPSASRSARTSARSIITALRADGEQVIDLSGSTPDSAASNLERALDRNEIDRIVLAGGDGLVHLAIQHLAETTIPITIAPIGSGNDFAHAIREHNNSGTGVASDLIRVTTPAGDVTWVASVAIAGFPAMINARANTMGRSWGSSVYALATVRELPTFARETFEISIDGIPITTDSAMLAIGNTKYFGGGMLPCPDALPDDGIVHVTSIEGVDRRGLLPHLLGRAGGTADRKEVLQGTGQRIEIESHGREFWADGEFLGTSPLTFELVPGALWIEHVTTPSV